MKKAKKITLREQIEEILDEVVKLTTRNFGHPVPKVNREIFYKDAINATDKILQAFRKRVPKKKIYKIVGLGKKMNGIVAVNREVGYSEAIDQINKELR